MYAIKNDDGKWFCGFFYSPFSHEGGPITRPKFDKEILRIIKKDDLKQALKDLEKYGINCTVVKLTEEQVTL